jgi:hypothetical protein
LNPRFCRRHVDQYKRHGSYYRKSYRADELEVHRSQARAWLNARTDDPAVLSAADVYSGDRDRSFRFVVTG